MRRPQHYQMRLEWVDFYRVDRDGFIDVLEEFEVQHHSRVDR